jgi:hypothetical protein
MQFISFVMLGPCFEFFLKKKAKLKIQSLGLRALTFSVKSFLEAPVFKPRVYICVLKTSCSLSFLGYRWRRLRWAEWRDSSTSRPIISLKRSFTNPAKLPPLSTQQFVRIEPEDGRLQNGKLCISDLRKSNPARIL